MSTRPFFRRGATQIVIFENLDHVYEYSESRMPWGFYFVEDRGWSFLRMMAHNWSWYRDETVYDFFDRLRDDGFFDGFDKVVFMGHPRVPMRPVPIVQQHRILL